jgi:hypothetical protein
VSPNSARFVVSCWYIWDDPSRLLSHFNTRKVPMTDGASTPPSTPERAGCVRQPTAHFSYVFSWQCQDDQSVLVAVSSVSSASRSEVKALRTFRTFAHSHTHQVQPATLPVCATAGTASLSYFIFPTPPRKISPSLSLSSPFYHEVLLV